jgi:hypothetical protein
VPPGLFFHFISPSKRTKKHLAVVDSTNLIRLRDLSLLLHIMIQKGELFRFHTHVTNTHNLQQGAYAITYLKTPGNLEELHRESP